MDALSIPTPLIRCRPDTPAAPGPPLKSVGGRRLLRRLGAGGMSEVYLAYDAGRHAYVAVKVLPDDLAQNPTYVHRFQREADLGQQIAHPNVVRCLEVGQEEGTGRRFLVMEYVKGASGQTRLERTGPFPLADALAVVLDIARALEELHHRGFVHRDVKPGNILIAEDGRAKLADLGVAKLLADGQDLTSFDSGIGTPYYMPWEQSLNASLVDPRSDLFALGATFYHLLTGRVPFPGKDVAEVAKKKEDGEYVPARRWDPTLPRSVDSILAKLMARVPKERFQTAAELVAALTASGLTGEKAKPNPNRGDTDVPPAATRKDPNAGKKPRPKVPLWTYQHKHGSGWKKGRAPLADIVQWFEQGALPEELFLAPPGKKTCRHVRTFPQFRDLPRQPDPTPPPTTALPKPYRLGRLWVYLVAAAGLTAAMAVLLHQLAGG